MALFFFDSSAIIKLHINEAGTSWVKSIADPAAGNRIYIARIAGAEVVSAIVRRGRAGSLSANGARTAVSDFRYDYANLYRVVEVGRALIARAMSLAEVHALRGYDAVQLAAVTDVSHQRLSAGLSTPTLVSADTALNVAATSEGLTVDNPNVH